ncbi:MAG TPA: zinc-ribbon domain-containing protein, partial [Holophaga sp.]|nr:zinc-ribbon domain-containing protein [Holophaga sp.]
MLASVHCPTCSTHYGLRASRVRAGLRRARCFRCASVFDIEATVFELMAEPPVVAAEASLVPEDLLDVRLE